mmetsp:Transcript_27825/g.43777  ORF Transcript_27825/g.43777 Transcript_27825/m.43777 type:complete len:96 (-) Transcript_27825:148-435(-)
MNDISSVSNVVEMTCLWSMRPWRMSRFLLDFLSSRENVVPGEGLLLLAILCRGGHDFLEAADFDMVLAMLLCYVVMLLCKYVLSVSCVLLWRMQS